jgi:DNA polymerase-3 subunit epsilon
VYAVIDLETTGLRPEWHDRIVEIAVVHVDTAGGIEREWATLVNPRRDLGPQHVHAISAAEARRAPTFADLAGDIVELLRGRAVVAHNLAFDGPFLASEYTRLGVTVPVGAESGLCTMTLAGAFLPDTGRSLRACCDAVGVALRRAHAAVHDARAAAGLLAFFLAQAGQPPPWAGLVARARSEVWPRLERYGARTADREHESETRPHERAERATSEHFVTRLVDRLPRTYQPDVDAYLAVLDKALAGGHLSTVDADALVAVATDLGLARAEAHALHLRYVRSLAAVAAAAGPLDAADRSDLDAVALALGLQPSDVDSAMAGPGDAAGPGDPGDPAGAAGAAGLLPVTPFRLKPGDEVVFTGQTREPREDWQARALAAGLVVGESVTRRTRLLVAADPDTMSGKADRAHRYGIPVVHPAGFTRLLGQVGP